MANHIRDAIYRELFNMLSEKAVYPIVGNKKQMALTTPDITEAIDMAMYDIERAYGDFPQNHVHEGQPSEPSFSDLIPQGWNVECIMYHECVGYIISSPRVNGVANNTSVWEDDQDPGHRFLWHILNNAMG